MSNQKPPLKTPAEVRAAFAAQPKLLDSWLMVGYRRYWKAKNTVKPSTRTQEADAKVAALSTEDYRALKRRLRATLNRGGK